MAGENLKMRQPVPDHILSSELEQAIVDLPYSEREYHNEEVVKMNKVRIQYGERIILKDLDWTVLNGEKWALSGENGAGKSTLLSLVCADNPQSYACDISLFGRKRGTGESIWEIKKHIGYVSPEMHRAYLKNLPAIEIVASGLHDSIGLYKRPHQEQMAVCEWWMDVFGIASLKDKPFLQLSSGEQRLALLARAFVKDPELLILDEPTAVLTEKEAEALLDSIRGMSAKGIAVIFITHRLHEILTVCDTVVIMRDGYVVKDVPSKETDVADITKWMVGRNIQSTARADIRINPDARPIMSIRNLWVDMPGETVRNVNLDIKEGAILGIGGLAGQGKLGIPNGVMGLYEAGGSVEFDGHEIPLNNPRKCLDSSLAFVSEDRRDVGLLLDETLEWNIAFSAMQIQDKFLKNYLGGLIKWRDEKAIHEVTQKYIDELMIKCTSSLQKAKELSGGNQQKVCLAKAFALEPKFLFVSEPTRGIDVGAKSLVLDALKQFNKEHGVTVVMISSELEELRTTCDRIAIVSGGKIAGILPATESSEEFGLLMVSQVK